MSHSSSQSVLATTLVQGEERAVHRTHTAPSRKAASIEKLPNELLLQIFSYLPDDQHHWPLLLTARIFLKVTRTALYTSVEFTEKHGRKHILKFLRTVILQPEIAELVKTLKLASWKVPQNNKLKRSRHAIFAVSEMKTLMREVEALVPRMGLTPHEQRHPLSKLSEGRVTLALLQAKLPSLRRFQYDAFRHAQEQWPPIPLTPLILFEQAELRPMLCNNITHLRLINSRTRTPLPAKHMKLLFLLPALQILELTYVVVDDDWVNCFYGDMINSEWVSKAPHPALLETSPTPWPVRTSPVTTLRLAQCKFEGDMLASMISACTALKEFYYWRIDGGQVKGLGDMPLARLLGAHKDTLHTLAFNCYNWGSSSNWKFGSFNDFTALKTAKIPPIDSALMPNIEFAHEEPRITVRLPQTLETLTIWNVNRERQCIEAFPLTAVQYYPKLWKVYIDSYTSDKNFLEWKDAVVVPRFNEARVSHEWKYVCPWP